MWISTMSWWFHLTLIISFEALVIHAKQSNGGANLTVEWIYSNPGSMLESGRICDRLGQPECDVYFTLCLRNAASDDLPRAEDKCGLHQSSTKYYNNVEYLKFEGEKAVHLYIPGPVPTHFSFEMSIYDVDLVDPTQSIGHFVAQDFLLPNRGIPTPVPMRRQNTGYSNMHLKLQVTMTLQCVENFYGEHCTKECVPKPEVYQCDDAGGRICMQGFTGDKCDQEDWCLYQPCAEHAICINRPDGQGRLCQCNGGEGIECYPGYDPCSSAPCQHNGVCHRSGAYNESFECECVGMWTGHRCTEQRSACAEELNRLKQTLQNDTDEELNVCLNGGQCMEYKDKLDYQCACTKGWTGKKCELPETNAPQSGNMVTILIFLVGISLFVLIIVLIIIGVWRYRIWKRSKLMAKHGGIVYFHTTSDTSGTGNSLLGTPGQYMNQVYNIPEMFASPEIAGKKSQHNVYDECDALELAARNHVYGTAFGQDVPVSLGRRVSAATGSSLRSADIHDEAPPLPERPKNLGSIFSGQSSLSKMQSSRSNSSVHSPNGSTVNLIPSPSDHRHPTYYRPVGSAGYYPSTFFPSSPSVK